MARALGLDVGDERVMDPAKFLDDLEKRNQDKAEADASAPSAR